MPSDGATGGLLLPTFCNLINPLIRAVPQDDAQLIVRPERIQYALRAISCHFDCHWRIPSRASPAPRMPGGKTFLLSSSMLTGSVVSSGVLR